MLKKENGVTLVALVITIIVLLILAGITLAMVMGDSGIFGKANTAKINTAISDAKDAVSLAILEAVADQYSDTDGSLVAQNDAKRITGTTTTDYAIYNKHLNGYVIDTASGKIAKGSTYDANNVVKDADGKVLTIQSYTLPSGKNAPTYSIDLVAQPTV